MRARDRLKTQSGTYGQGTITTKICHTAEGRVLAEPFGDYLGVYLSVAGLRQAARRFDAMADAIESGANR